MKIKLLFITLFVGGLSWGQIAQFNFPATSSLVVSVKDANVTVSNFSLSSGTIETNITTGTYFPDEPYIEETSGWTSLVQSTAKNFTLTITPSVGFVVNITNISFRSYSTSAGPSAIGFAIGGTDIYSVNSPDSSLLTVNQVITGQNNLTSAVIKIQGWLNGSRVTSGSGVLRLDDVVISGTVTPISSCIAPTVSTTAASTITTASTTLNGNVTAIGGGTNVTERGFQYATNSSLTTASTVSTIGIFGVSSYSQGLTGLIPNTLYYYRGYAINDCSTPQTGFSHASSFPTFTTLHNSPNSGSGSNATSISFIANWGPPLAAGLASFTYTLEVDDDISFGSINFTQSSISSGTTSINVTGLNPSTPYYYRVKVVNAGGSSSWFTTPSTYSTLGIVSSLTDIITFGGVPTSISSTINDAAPLSSSSGVQVWQFKVRDGGAGLNDLDTLPSILTSLTFSQAAGNQVGTWSDAINTIALFDGSTYLATGIVIANQVQFPILNVNVADNSEKVLSLRLSLKCPLGANAFDGNDFGFQISNGNVTFSSLGSSKTTFAATSTPNGSVIIDVTATKLVFTQQPTNTGVNSSMANVVINAKDACGNTDLGYTGTISLTSTGVMTGSPISINAIAGIATFPAITHTTIGTGFTLSTTSSLPQISSSIFDITSITVFKPGDIAILAVNTKAESSGSADEISFVCFQDVLPGTTLYLTDNGYERVFPGLWGNTEGIISLTRTTTTLLKGTVITIHTVDNGVNEGTDFTIYTCGTVDLNWTRGVASSALNFFDLNKDDQLWIAQGGTWNNVSTGLHDCVYTGNVLYGWTDITWKSAPAWDISNGTKGSTIYPKMDCFTTDVANPETGASQVKFNDPINPDFSTVTNGKYDWIALINNAANWNYYTTDADFDSSGFDYLGSTSCPIMTLATDVYINGKWTGKKDTNWFNCGNWDTLTVPDATVDVQVGDNIYNNQAIIDATAPFASYFGNVATAKNLTITGEKVEITSGNSNILEVHGNLLLDAPAGVLDMDDGNSLTSDGQLFLYGNWTNNMGNVAFEEGNGTVQFVGSTSQIINNVMPEGTETFYNVIMNNNFDTQVSNDLIATGDLTLNANKIITVNTNDYLQINKSLINNGTFNIKNTGQLVQVEDSGVNSGTGNFVMERTATVARTTDYVYWSSPISNFQVGNVNPSSWLRYKWIPTIPRAYASNFGGWLATPANEVMEKGKGYIIRGPYTNPTATFTNAAPNNLPNNGIIPVGVERSTYDGAPYTYLSGSTTLTVVKDDDNYNLLGNPYPSAVDVQKFLALNTNLAGHIRLWTHGTPIQSSLFNGQSFYNSFGYTYSVLDYIYVNYTGISSGPGDYAIASGQGFFVTMNHSSASTTENVIFNNSMRRDVALGTIFNNSVFYRKANTNERNRIWLDILDDKNASVRTLVGYIQGATLDKDRLYDAKVTVDSNLNIYSLIQDESQIIQARPLPFDKDDRVPLGVSIPLKVGNTTSTLGTYKIAIAFADGLFQNKNQDIYLEDRLLNVIHDLRKNPYTFESVSGRFDNRFVLRYTNKNKSLGTEHFKEYGNSVVVATNAGQVNIMSSIEAIKRVAIYDVLGREIFTKNNINAMELSIKDIIINRQALVVKVVLENGQEVSKKIIL